MPPKQTKSKSPSQKSADPCVLKSFPEKNMRDLLAETFPNGTVTDEASAYLSSIMQYVQQEIIELSVNAAKTRTGSEAEVKLTKNDVLRAINTDQEMKQLVESTKKQEEKEN